MWKGVEKRLQAIEDLSFKKTDGGYLFFPYGTLAPGYQVSEEKKAELGEFVRQYYLIAIPLAVVLVIIGSWLVAASFFFALLTYYAFGINRRLKGAWRSKERLSFMETQRRLAEIMPNWLLYLFLACSVLMTALGIFVTFIGLWKGNQNEFLIGAASAVFFGAGVVLAIIQFRLKRSGQAP